MKLFNEKYILDSLDRSYQEILARKKIKGYIRGFNDCWALVCLYDFNLRAGNSRINKLSLNSYKDDKDFLFQLFKKGFRNFDDLAKYCGYDKANNIMAGDIAVCKNINGLGFKIAHKDYWITSNRFIKDISHSRDEILYLYRPEVEYEDLQHKFF